MCVSRMIETELSLKLMVVAHASFTSVDRDVCLMRIVIELEVGRYDSCHQVNRSR